MARNILVQNMVFEDGRVSYIFKYTEIDYGYGPLRLTLLCNESIFPSRSLFLVLTTLKQDFKHHRGCNEFFIKCLKYFLSSLIFKPRSKGTR